MENMKTMAGSEGTPDAARAAEGAAAKTGVQEADTSSERRQSECTRRTVDRRQGPPDLRRGLQDVEQWLLAGPTSGGLEAWVDELGKVLDVTAPLMKRHFGRAPRAAADQNPHKVTQQPSQLQALRRRGRSLLIRYGRYRELVRNAFGANAAAHSEELDFQEVFGTLAKGGLQLILNCRKHETNLAGSAQESAYWEDSGGG